MPKSKKKDTKDESFSNLDTTELNLSSSGLGLSAGAGLDLDPELKHMKAVDEDGLENLDMALNDEALNFDLDFDAMAGALGASLPDINLDDLGSLGRAGDGSLGTRSPSIGSQYSKSSKRSRAEFDENSLNDESCDSSYQGSQKQQRMLFHTGGIGGDAERYGLIQGSKSNIGGDYSNNYNHSATSPNKVIRQGRERDGRCPDCGLDTHRVIMTDNSFELQPLTIEGEVLNGRCLLCNPLSNEDMGIPGAISNLTEGSSGNSVGVSKSKKGRSRKSNDSTSKKKGSSRSKKGSGSRKGRSAEDMDTASPSQQQRQFAFAPPPRNEKRSSPSSHPYNLSNMAFQDQARLPRKHSAMQHAALVFGQTNNRSSSGGNTMKRRSSSGVSGGRRSSISRQLQHSSNSSVSSVSCSEVESSRRSNTLGDENDNYSRGSQGGRGSVNMGGMCAETAMQMTRSMSNQGSGTPPAGNGDHPQSPIRRMGSSSRTPQSVPVNMRDKMMTNSRGTTPQSVPANMQSRMDMSSIPAFPDIIGNAPQSIKLEHSKLQSSIYHHHLFPMNNETERAQAEKTLLYLESGSGDICDIIVAMRRFPFSLAIQRVACEKLYAHCFDKEHASAIGLVGGIRTIIDAMEHHPDDVALQRGCAGVIKHLATASSYNLDMLDRMGTVPIIVSTMGKHPANAPLLESCCWAMESIARAPSPELKMRVVKAGGIHATMKVVETFPNNESLLRAAFHCLRQLGYNPSSYGGGGPGQPGGGGGQQQMQQQGSGGRGGMMGSSSNSNNYNGSDRSMMGSSSSNNYNGNNRRM